MEDRLIGTVLDGRYTIKEVVGKGGMSIVYKAEDNVEGKYVAVKVLKDEFVKDPKFRRRFLNESRAVAMLSHENIVDVLDVNFEGSVQYIVMEYLDGPTLKEYMQKNGVLGVYDALHITEQILSALKHAHERGVVHRDIKPQNIILVDDETVKVMDFGIAHVQNFSTVTISDQAIGTVHYISPEQAKGHPADERSDLYSTGVMLYEMLTGRLPFDGDTAVAVALMQVQQKPVAPSEYIPGLPVGIEQIVMKAMRKNVSSRYQNADEMLTDIEKFRENADIVFPYESGTEEWTLKETNEPNAKGLRKVGNFVKKRTQNRWLAIGIGACAAAVIVVISVFLMSAVISAMGKNYEKVPNLIGRTYDEVCSDEKIINNFTIRQKLEDSEKPKGEILEQDPPSGESVERGEEIIVYVSSGVSPYTTVPEGIVNLPYSKAVALLTDSNLGYNLEYDYNDSTVESDVVMSCTPAEGEKVLKNSVVTLHINVKKDDPSTMIEIPSTLVGVTESAAAEILKGLGLKYTTVFVDSSLAAGLVTKVYPSVGQSVPVGSSITLYISNGSNVKPTEPTAPTQPTQPVDPTQPTDPTKPIEPIEPSDPA